MTKFLNRSSSVTLPVRRAGENSTKSSVNNPSGQLHTLAIEVPPPSDNRRQTSNTRIEHPFFYSLFCHMPDWHLVALALGPICRVSLASHIFQARPTGLGFVEARNPAYNPVPLCSIEPPPGTSKS